MFNWLGKMLGIVPAEAASEAPAAPTPAPAPVVAQAPIPTSAASLESNRLAAIANNTYYAAIDGCHVRETSAELQFSIDGNWKLLAGAMGWIEATNCPATHPVQPWNIIEREPFLELRWRIWNPGAWEAFSKPFFHTPILISSPTPTPSPSPSSLQLKPSATPKPTTTIMCVKGKTKKKVVGIKPKCPSGYRIQR